MSVQCRGCGQADPPDRHDGGHVVIVPGHDLECEGTCESCPVPVQELCGPLEEVAP